MGRRGPTAVGLGARSSRQRQGWDGSGRMVGWLVAVGRGWYASVVRGRVQGVVRGSGGEVREITSLGPVKDNRSRGSRRWC